MIAPLRQAFVTLMLLTVALLPAPLRAEAAPVPAQTIWRLLDYMAVDYGGAVADGRVVNKAEYVEMTEFAGTVRARLAALPETSERAGLVRDAASLESAIRAKAPPLAVAASARRLAAALLAAYPVPLAPSATPDLKRGAALYAENCASCHGASGDGRGPAAAGLDPSPVDFTDETRARERSPFAYYQVIEQGLDGTAMPGFAQLSPDDRWALAFSIARFAYPNRLAGEGERTWRENSAAQGEIPNMTALAGTTPAALARVLGDEKAGAVLAYLRGHPEVVGSSAAASLTLSKAKLAESLAAYKRGDARAATDLALSAYLDGFEPVEPVLASRNAALMARIEAAMSELRARIDRGAGVEDVRAQAETVGALFGEAEIVLESNSASDASSFIGAFTILLREGLEALLIVIAIVAFLRKAERRDVLAYVHGGWTAALGAGALTWVAATYLISVSGASRELTEGFGSLFAAAVLLSVGIWMHGKAQADAWQRYVREKMSAALSKGSAWFLFSLTFVVVYREVFETILFYATLWAQGNAGAVLAGAGAAVAVLTVVAWAMLRFSRRLPIAKFFAYSSALIAVLAVVLAGKGVAALQEAGLLDVRPLAGMPRIAMLGFFPTREAVLGQLAALAIVIVGFWFNKRRAVQSADA